MANISLAEALLAGGSGLFKGLNANREKREADKRYEDNVAYERSRKAVEDQYNRLKLSNEKKHEENLSKFYDTMETPDQKAARDAAKGEIRKYVANLSAATARIRAKISEQNNIRTNTRISESDKSRLLAGQAEEIGREMRNLRDIRTQLTTAKTFANKDDLQGILGGIAEADSMLSSYGSQAPGLYKSAGEALNSAPVQSVAPDDGDGPDVPGATYDAIETPAPQDQLAPDQFSGATLGQAMQPQAAPPQQTLGAAMGSTSGHEPGPIPPEVRSGIHKELVAKGYTPGSSAYNKAFTMAAIGWQKKNRPVSQ